MTKGIYVDYVSETGSRAMLYSLNKNLARKTTAVPVVQRCGCVRKKMLILAHYDFLLFVTDSVEVDFNLFRNKNALN